MRERGWEGEREGEREEHVFKHQNKLPQTTLIKRGRKKEEDEGERVGGREGEREKHVFKRQNTPPLTTLIKIGRKKEEDER